MNKKLFKPLIVAVILTATICFFTGCNESNSEPVAKAPNGTYIGQNNNGIDEFLGIRYGEMENFKAPTDITTTTDDTIEAKKWGENCIQPYDAVEVASQDPCSQDCLFLNIWTKDIETKNKPVIMFIHGGGFVRGGSTDPMYDGEEFIRNLPENEDAVFVTINYRLSFMGGADLSVLDGYTDEYYDAINLSHLDQTQALKWIDKNIEAFGGDPERINVAGQSSGGNAVQLLMSDPKANKYIKGGIEDSGVAFFVMETKEEMKASSKRIFEILGVTSVDELTALTDEEISKKMDQITSEVNTGLRCADGKIISETWWDDQRNGAAKDINLLIGSTNGEFDYHSMNWDDFPNPYEDYTVLEKKLRERHENSSSNLNLNQASSEEIFADLPENRDPVYGSLDFFNYDGLLENYLNLGDDKAQLMQDLYNDSLAPYPNTLIADAQSQYNENTYLYYWEWAPEKTSVIDYAGDSAEVSPWGRALHCMDACIAFGTLEEGYPELTGDPEKIPEKLVQQTQLMWYYFAKTGNPNNETISEWTPYTEEVPSTMVITPEGKWECRDNYRQEAMDVLSVMRPFGEM